MRRGIAVLHSAVVSAAQKYPSAIKQSCADWNSALGEPALRFFEGGFEQRQIFRLVHLCILAAFDARIARRGGVVELHQDNERDAPIRVENTEQRTKPVKRLSGPDTAVDGGHNFGVRIALDEA